MNQSILIIVVFVLIAMLVTTPLLLLWLTWAREKNAVLGRTGKMLPEPFMRPSTAMFLAAMIFIGVLELCTA